jgi:hypothetical protein
MNRNLVALVCVVSMASTALPQTAPSCTTHFYNKSNFQWSIYNFDGQKTSLLIQPNTTVEIQWGNTSAITIGGNIPNRPVAKQFQVQSVDGCVVLQSQGPASNLLINKPNKGDITTCTGGC